MCLSVGHISALHRCFWSEHKTIPEFNALEWTHSILRGGILWLDDVFVDQLEACGIGNCISECQVLECTCDHSDCGNWAFVHFPSCVLLKESCRMEEAKVPKEVWDTSWRLHLWHGKQVASCCYACLVYAQESFLCHGCAFTEWFPGFLDWLYLTGHLGNFEPPLTFPHVQVTSEKDHWDLQRTYSVGEHLLFVPVLGLYPQTIRSICHRVCLHGSHRHCNRFAAYPNDSNFNHRLQTLVQETHSAQSRWQNEEAIEDGESPASWDKK